MLDRWLKRWSWRNLRIASGAQEWLRRRFTPAGQAVLAGTLAAGVFGIDTRMTAAHQAFALGAALLLIAALGRLRGARGLSAMRRLPRRASAGEPCHYRVRLQHTGTRLLTGLALAERLPDPRPNKAAFLTTRAPIEARLNPLERLLGYPRWEWMVRQGRRLEPQPPLPLRDLAPGEAIEQRMTLVPTRRGPLRLDALVAARTEPLGLMRRELPLAAGDRLLVLPRRYPVPALRQAGRRRLQPGGVNLAAAVSDSKEFIGLRDYLPGDSPRDIHWAAWARSGEPVVKEYQDELFSRQALILDSFVDDGADGHTAPGEREFECAVSVAASLVEPLSRAGAREDALLDLMFVAGRAHRVTGGRGLASTDHMLEILASLPADHHGHFATLGELVLAQAAQLSACICVLLRWDPPRQDLVRRLRALGLPVQVLLVAGPDLADPPPGTIRVEPDDPASALARLGAAAQTPPLQPQLA